MLPMVKPPPWVYSSTGRPVSVLGATRRAGKVWPSRAAVRTSSSRPSSGFGTSGTPMDLA